MATQDILVPIDFGGGIDQTADPKQTIPTKLSDLRNARLEYGKRISKRYGMRRVVEMINPQSPTERVQGDLLANLGDQLVIQRKGDGVDGIPELAYSTGNTSFRDFATLVGNRNIGVELEVNRIPIATTSSATLVDSVSQYGMTLYAYESVESSVSGCSFVLVDSATGAIISENSYGDARRPRVNKDIYGFVFAYINTISNNIPIRYFPLATGTRLSALSPVITLTGLSASNRNWDWDVNIPVGVFSGVFVSSVANTINRFEFETQPPALTANAAFTVSTGAIGALGFSDNNGNSVLSYYDATTGLNVRYVSGPGSAANYVINSSTADAVEAIAIAANATSGDGSTSVVMAQYTAASTTSRRISAHYISPGVPPFVYGINTHRSVGLASKAFRRDKKLYVLAAHQSPLQSHYLLLELPRLAFATQFIVRARILFGDATGYVQSPHLPTANVLGADVFAFCALRRERTFSQNNTILSVSTPIELRVNFALPGTCRAVEIAETLSFASGVVGTFDGGAGIVENNFLLGPEIVTATRSAGSGNVTNGTYQVVALYEWTDSRGKLNRSQPSVPFTVVVTGGAGSDRISVVLPTLRISNKDPFGLASSVTVRSRPQLVRIAVYRTTNNGTLFYRASATPSEQESLTIIDSVTFLDGASDATLLSRDLLYTTGGILPFWSPNSCSAICATADRVFVNDLGDPGLIYFSNKIVAGEPAEFSQSLYLRFGSGGGGKVTALASIDDRIVIFKQRELWITSGQGPDGTGTFGTFADVQKLPFDGGADSQASVLVTPLGVIAKCANGFNLLGRDLSWNYIGAQVRTYDTAAVVSSVLLQDAQEARFLLTDGTWLVYNYQFLDERGLGQWSVTDFSALDACYTRSGKFYALESTTRFLYVEDPTIFVDQFLNAGADRSIPLTITTAWIRTSGIQGFQRIKQIVLLGDFRSTHTLTVEIGYDYEDAFDPVPYTITGLDATNAASAAYQIKIQPRQRQKCESIRIRISDSGTGESFDLNAMSLLVGTMAGTYRTQTAKRAK